MQRTASCFIQSATTGFTAKGFLSHYRVSPKEAFKGPEPDDGKPSRPVLRGPAPSNGGWLLGSSEMEISRQATDDLMIACERSNSFSLFPSQEIGEALLGGVLPRLHSEKGA